MKQIRVFHNIANGLSRGDGWLLVYCGITWLIYKGYLSRRAIYNLRRDKT